MRIRFFTVMLLCLPVVLFSCAGDTAGTQQDNTSNVYHAPAAHTKNYLHTGFYYLGNESSGVGIKEEGTGKPYILAPKPFASVYNIRKTEIVHTPAKDGTYTELCLSFDAKGTADLMEGTGNPQQPYIALVIAGKLLYVVQNRDKIKTGIMYVGMGGYSEQEINNMKQAVDHKQ